MEREVGKEGKREVYRVASLLVEGGCWAGGCGCILVAGYGRVRPTTVIAQNSPASYVRRHHHKQG